MAADGQHYKEYELTDELTCLGCMKRAMRYKATVWWKPDSPVSTCCLEITGTCMANLVLKSQISHPRC
jgi:hypothetical protein